MFHWSALFSRCCTICELNYYKAKATFTQTVNLSVSGPCTVKSLVSIPTTGFHSNNFSQWVAQLAFTWHQISFVAAKMQHSWGRFGVWVQHSAVGMCFISYEVKEKQCEIFVTPIGRCCTLPLHICIRFNFSQLCHATGHVHIKSPMVAVVQPNNV